MKHTMGNLVLVGLQQLRTDFGTYEQFVVRLWNVFKVPNIRTHLWIGILGAIP